MDEKVNHLEELPPEPAETGAPKTLLFAMSYEASGTVSEAAQTPDEGDK